MPQSDLQCITTPPPAPNEATAEPANDLGTRDRHEALTEVAYMSARMAHMLPAAMALLRTISIEMADARVMDKLCQARALRDWARQINWIIDHVEQDVDQLRTAAADAGFMFGGSEIAAP